MVLHFSCTTKFVVLHKKDPPIIDKDKHLDVVVEAKFANLGENRNFTPGGLKCCIFQNLNCS